MAALVACPWALSSARSWETSWRSRFTSPGSCLKSGWGTLVLLKAMVCGGAGTSSSWSHSSAVTGSKLDDVANAAKPWAAVVALEAAEPGVVPVIAADSDVVTSQGAAHQWLGGDQLGGDASSSLRPRSYEEVLWPLILCWALVHGGERKGRDGAWLHTGHQSG